MSCYLLDTNVLIPLLWPRHRAHAKVEVWFQANAKHSFATCSFTQAGFLRLATTPKIMLETYTLSEARQLLLKLTELPGHTFLPTTMSIFEAMAPYQSRMQGAKQITDAYLLGIARGHTCKLATFDRAIKSLAGNHSSQWVELLT